MKEWCWIPEASTSAVAIRHIGGHWWLGGGGGGGKIGFFEGSSDSAKKITSAAGYSKS